MGRSYTPKYRVETRENTNPTIWNTQVWDCKVHGRPTDINAEKYRKKYNESFLPGGVNGPQNGNDIITHIFEVRVIKQKTGVILALAKAPSFEIY